MSTFPLWRGQSIPLSLDLAFTKGYIRNVEMQGENTVGTYIRPAAGYLWLIMDGVIDHLGQSGDLTSLAVFMNKLDGTPDVSSAALVNKLMWLSQTIANGTYPLFPTTNGDVPSTSANPLFYFQGYTLCIVTEDMSIVFQANSAAYAKLKLLEWQVPTRH